MRLCKFVVMLVLSCKFSVKFLNRSSCHTAITDKINIDVVLVDLSHSPTVTVTREGISIEHMFENNDPTIGEYELKLTKYCKRLQIMATGMHSNFSLLPRSPLFSCSPYAFVHSVFFFATIAAVQTVSGSVQVRSIEFCSHNNGKAADFPMPPVASTPTTTKGISSFVIYYFQTL